MWKLLDEIRVLMTRRDKVRMAVLVVLMVIAGGLEIVGISILMPVVAVLSKPEISWLQKPKPQEARESPARRVSAMET